MTDTLSSARLAVISAARERVGWTAGEDRYRDLVAPSDTLQRQEQVERESDCERVVEGVLAVCFNITDGPYIDGTAFPRLYSLAGGSPWAPGGAMRVPTLEAPPRPADVLVWGDSPDKQHPAHVELLVSWERGDVIAGGQRMDPPRDMRETVRALTRTNIEWDGKRFVDRVTERPLIGCVDADILAARYGVQGDASSGDGGGESTT